jgi:AcrR family transcriptional regulator
MEINRPSLYAALGNKEELFRKVLGRYQTGPQGFLTEALAKPTARAVVAASFPGFIRMLRGRDKARGCLIVCGALACGEDAEPARRELARLRESVRVNSGFESALTRGSYTKSAFRRLTSDIGSVAPRNIAYQPRPPCAPAAA